MSQLILQFVFIIAPATPIVDVTRCSRSEDAVVLALCPPKSVHDLVDQYEVHFCSEEQKNIELEVLFFISYYNQATSRLAKRQSMNSNLEI